MKKNKSFYLKILTLVIGISILLLVIYNTKFSTEVYNSSNLGISLNFPKDWNDKYTIVEKNDSMYVYFVSNNSNQKGLLFAIVKLNSNNNPVDGELYDSIGTGKTLDINGDKYKVGGSTDIGFPEDNPDYKTYEKMKDKTSQIIKSLKTSK